ncbi:hypothetical protein SD71_16165 [Cohnella kolymensis]|uniref:Uncharacterized protein n=1 Tax=Cohnella kolymensis TaxID=1590652 RepID=A0ABR5A295_9BACL|nr:hypothetical protein [Cohnella kolymensis]KIL35160.1 hypothetical protein SD71_16165 [Cohnella kolymensis]
MSISVELKFIGDVATPEHQAAIKKIMDAAEQTVNQLPGLGYQVKSNRFEVKTSANSRMMTQDGLINSEPFPEPFGFMHEAKMQFGFHLNPVVKPAEPADSCPDKQ